MKYILMLLMSSSIFCIPSEYESSAKIKSMRYAMFLKGIELLEQEESLADRRSFTVPIIIITAEDHEDFEWHLLKKEDFEPSIRASTPE